MVRIQVDHSNVEKVTGKKIREVVEHIAGGLPSNRIVTSVYVDGKLLTSSQVKSLETNIDTFQELKVHTSDPEIWRENGIDLALSSIEKIQRSLLSTAGAFQEKKASLGRRLLGQCADGLDRFIDTIAITRTVLKLDFETRTIEQVPLSRLETNLERILSELLDKHTPDFDTAELIEYELLPCLSLWVKALNQIRTASSY